MRKREEIEQWRPGEEQEEGGGEEKNWRKRENVKEGEGDEENE